MRKRYEGRAGVGIGVNSGPVVAGTVGGGGRVEFTVVGDAVNTAARVEAATRETGDDVLVTEATCALPERERFVFEERPPVPLKGKREQVRLWALVEPAADQGAGADGAAAGAAADLATAPISLPQAVSVGRDQTCQDQPV